MGKKYQQLGRSERERIMVLHSLGWTHAEISRDIGRSKSTVTRELNRNGTPGSGLYSAWGATDRSRKRKRKAGQRERLKNATVRLYAREKLEAGWTPETISGWLRRKGSATVSHESIYQWIYADAPDLIGYLPRHHRKRLCKGHSRKHQRSHIPNRVAIDQRPAEVDDHSEFGHWEADSIVSRASKAALNVILERKSRRLCLTKLPQKSAGHTSRAMVARLGSLPTEACLTITYDNGSENTEHGAVNKVLGTDSFFCAPYHSWEKGAVESINGLIRRYIPKGTDIEKITEEQIRWIEWQLNNRPRKCLGYQTPAEVFDKLCGALAA
jgi:IS30 family transposase